MMLILVVQVSSPGLEGPRDLLNPGSLFYFSAVSRVRDPPSKQSEPLPHLIHPRRAVGNRPKDQNMEENICTHFKENVKNDINTVCSNKLNTQQEQ